MLPRSLIAASFIVAAFSAAAADADRGQTLYETRCVSCHASSVHQRESRKATRFDEVRAQVARWNANLGGAWKDEEIDDVTVFLNRRYYGYPCPPAYCGSDQARLGH